MRAASSTVAAEAEAAAADVPAEAAGTMALRTAAAVLWQAERLLLIACEGEPPATAVTQQLLQQLSQALHVAGEEADFVERWTALAAATAGAVFTDDVAEATAEPAATTAAEQAAAATGGAAEGTAGLSPAVPAEVLACCSSPAHASSSSVARGDAFFDSRPSLLEEGNELLRLIAALKACRYRTVLFGSPWMQQLLAPLLLPGTGIAGSHEEQQQQVCAAAVEEADGLDALERVLQQRCAAFVFGDTGHAAAAAGSSVLLSPQEEATAGIAAPAHAENVLQQTARAAGSDGENGAHSRRGLSQQQQGETGLAEPSSGNSGGGLSVSDQQALPQQHVPLPRHFQQQQQQLRRALRARGVLLASVAAAQLFLQANYTGPPLRPTRPSEVLEDQRRRENARQDAPDPEGNSSSNSNEDNSSRASCSSRAEDDGSRKDSSGGSGNGGSSSNSKDSDRSSSSAESGSSGTADSSLNERRGRCPRCCPYCGACSSSRCRSTLPWQEQHKPECYCEVQLETVCLLGAADEGGPVSQGAMSRRSSSSSSSRQGSSSSSTPGTTSVRDSLSSFAAAHHDEFLEAFCAGGEEVYELVRGLPYLWLARVLCDWLATLPSSQCPSATTSRAAAGDAAASLSALVVASKLGYDVLSSQQQQELQKIRTQQRQETDQPEEDEQQQQTPHQEEEEQQQAGQQEEEQQHLAREEEKEEEQEPTRQEVHEETRQEGQGETRQPAETRSAAGGSCASNTTTRRAAAGSGLRAGTAAAEDSKIVQPYFLFLWRARLACLSQRIVRGAAAAKTSPSPSHLRVCVDEYSEALKSINLLPADFHPYDRAVDWELLATALELRDGAADAAAAQEQQLQRKRVPVKVLQVERDDDEEEAETEETSLEGSQKPQEDGSAVTAARASTGSSEENESTPPHVAGTAAHPEGAAAAAPGANADAAATAAAGPGENFEESSSCFALPQNIWEDRMVKTALLLELALHLNMYGRRGRFHQVFKLASEAYGVNFCFTGVEGIRREHQLHAVAQLVVLATRSAALCPPPSFPYPEPAAAASSAGHETAVSSSVTDDDAAAAAAVAAAERFDAAVTMWSPAGAAATAAAAARPPFPRPPSPLAGPSSSSLSSSSPAAVAGLLGSRNEKRSPPDSAGGLEEEEEEEQPAATDACVVCRQQAAGRARSDPLPQQQQQQQLKNEEEEEDREQRGSEYLFDSQRREWRLQDIHPGEDVLERPRLVNTNWALREAAERRLDDYERALLLAKGLELHENHPATDVLAMEQLNAVAARCLVSGVEQQRQQMRQRQQQQQQQHLQDSQKDGSTGVAVSAFAGEGDQTARRAPGTDSAAGRQRRRRPDIFEEVGREGEEDEEEEEGPREENRGKNWLLRSAALWLRCKAEYHRSKTVERASLQLHALIDALLDRRPRAPARLRYFFATFYPSWWEGKRELAVRMQKMGATLTAYESFRDLHMWEEAASCLLAAGRRADAEVLLLERLRVKETPALWCTLGDLKAEPHFYERAWRLSKGRCARAQRSLGQLHFREGELQEAADCFAAATAISPLNKHTWFTLGCCYMQLAKWTAAAQAFGRVVALDPESGDAWGNLAAIHAQQEAWHTARLCICEALRQKREIWRLWDSYLKINVRLRDVQAINEALRHFISLNAKNQIPLWIYAFLEHVLLRPGDMTEEQQQHAASPVHGRVCAVDYWQRELFGAGRCASPPNESKDEASAAAAAARRATLLRMTIETLVFLGEHVADQPELWRVLATLQEAADDYLAASATRLKEFRTVGAIVLRLEANKRPDEPLESRSLLLVNDQINCLEAVLRLLTLLTNIPLLEEDACVVKNCLIDLDITIRGFTKRLESYMTVKGGVHQQHQIKLFLQRLNPLVDQSSALAQKLKGRVFTSRDPKD